jgi:hypothetical protein
MKENNFEQKMEKFSEKIVDMKADNSAVDYYHSRLTQDGQRDLERKSEILRPIQGQITVSSASERKRWKGNLDIKSLTVKSLDFDFNRRQSICLE